MTRALLAAFPGRRRMAAALLLPLVAAAFVVVSSPASPAATGGVDRPVVWFGLALVAAGLGAGVLATYVPVTGRRLDLGCTPCAAMSALTVVGATIALRSYPADLTGPLLAIAVLLLGLTQRLSQPVACDAPAPQRGDAQPRTRAGSRR